jgi:hypothetical protein
VINLTTGVMMIRDTATTYLSEADMVAQATIANTP